MLVEEERGQGGVYEVICFDEVQNQQRDNAYPFWFWKLLENIKKIFKILFLGFLVLLFLSDSQNFISTPWDKFWRSLYKEGTCFNLFKAIGYCIKGTRQAITNKL